ncbi:hypothetical protein ACP4OV_009109 [Aristida adscensionis]
MDGAALRARRRRPSRKTEEVAVAGQLGDPVSEGSTKSAAAPVAEDVEEAAPAVAEEVLAAAAAAAEAAAEDEMKATDFIVAYKRLPRREININFILQSEVMRPFESTFMYKDMVADGSTTKEELEREAAEHEASEESFFRFQERVRRDYEEKGVVPVDDDYIAKRVEIQAMIEEDWHAAFHDLEQHDDSDVGAYSAESDLEDNRMK